MSTTLARGLLLAFFLAGALACASARRVQVDAAPALEWPAENPRVRLETVIRLETDEGGRFLRWLGEGESPGFAFRRPYGVAWDGPDLIVTDPDAGRVVRIDAKGRLTTSREGALVGPLGVIAACAGDGVVISDSRSGKVLFLDRDLARIEREVDGLVRPTGLACHGGSVFVLETGAHRLVALDPDGGRRSLGRRGEGPGEFNFPTALAPEGDCLLIGDTLNFRFLRFDPRDGTSGASFGALGDAPGDTPRIKGIAVDAHGLIWVSDGHLDLVSLFDADGTFLLSLGGTGSAPGQFSFPAGIAAHPDGRVAVVDSLNRRIQVFRVLGD